MRDIFIVGFALFSMFFGAGNLMFPPFLGMESGKDWLIPLIGFVDVREAWMMYLGELVKG